MKFAKLLGICGLLAGVIGLISCTGSSDADGLWLGLNQESQAPTYMLELKGNHLKLYFGIVREMDTAFETQAKIDRQAQESKEETNKDEKIPIALKNNAVYDVEQDKSEDAWAKVEEFYYSGGKLYMYLRYVLTDKLEIIVFEPYDENKDEKLKIYKWEEFKELQGEWSDSDTSEGADFRLQIKKDHLKLYMGDDVHFDGKFKIVKYLETDKIYLIDAETKYPHLPEEILDGLMWEDGKLIVKTVIYDLGVRETELFKK